MKRLLSFVLAFSVAVCLFGCKTNEREKNEIAELYRDYISRFESEGISPKIKRAAVRYKEQITREKSREECEKIVKNFAEEAESILIPPYKSNVDVSLYLTDSGYIKGDPTLTGISGYTEGKGDYYLESGTVAVYSESTLKAIMNADSEIREKLLKVTFANEIYYSTVISFTGSGEIVITDFYTPLGLELVRLLGGTVHDAGPVVNRGNYPKMGIKEGSNDFDFVADFDGGELKFTFNSRDGSVSRRHIFDREILKIYGTVTAIKNAAGGYGEEEFGNGVTKLLNIEYGNRIMEKSFPESLETIEERKREKLDLFIPENLDTTRENGVIVAIHGGSWVSGNKEDMHRVCATYTNAGYITAAINHTYIGRSFTDGEPSTFLTIKEEIRAAFEKIKQISDERGLNITKAATTGYSAGCHLALYYAYTYGNDENTPIPVVLASGLVGPLDFHEEHWEETNVSGLVMAAEGLNDKNIYDNGVTAYDEDELEEKLHSVSPLAYALSGDCTPTVVGYGQMDKNMVSYKPSLILHDAVKRAGHESVLVLFPNSDHLMATNPACGEVYRNELMKALRKYFQSG